MKETNGQIVERQKVHRDIPWPQVIVRKSGKVSWLMNLNLVCFHYRDHSTSWLLIFSGGFPRVGIYTLNWVVFQCLNPPTCCDLVDGGFTHQGTHPKEVEEHEAIWPKMRAKGNMMTVSCQSCSTEWKGGLVWGRSTDPVGRKSDK